MKFQKRISTDCWLLQCIVKLSQDKLGPFEMDTCLLYFPTKAEYQLSLLVMKMYKSVMSLSDLKPSFSLFCCVTLVPSLSFQGKMTCS